MSQDRFFCKSCFRHYLFKAGRITAVQLEGKEELEMGLEFYDDRLTQKQVDTAVEELERWVNGNT